MKLKTSILSDMEEQRRELAKSSHDIRVNIEALLENARSFDPDDALTNILGAMIPGAGVGFVLDPVVTREREILQVRSKFRLSSSGGGAPIAKTFGS